MRMSRGSFGGLSWRFVYHGDRMFEETDDANTPLGRGPVENGSYYSQGLLGGKSFGCNILRFPAYDGEGNYRWLVDQAGTACDHNEWDAFALILSDPSPQLNGWGGAWGYMSERPGNGLVQMGARWYWPELGRFIQQDPAREGVNWYAYVGNNPTTGIDPSGLIIKVVPYPNMDPKAAKADFGQARSYLEQVPWMQWIFAYLDWSPVVYTIRVGPFDRDRYERSERKILWDPHRGIGRTYGDQSPAIMLAHEIGHAITPDDCGTALGKATFPPGSEFPNWEEVLDTIFEIATSLWLGEGWAFNYHGPFLYDVPTVPRGR